MTAPDDTGLSPRGLVAVSVRPWAATDAAHSAFHKPVIPSMGQAQTPGYQRLHHRMRHNLGDAVPI